MHAGAWLCMAALARAADDTLLAEVDPLDVTPVAIPLEPGGPAPVLPDLDVVTSPELEAMPVATAPLEAAPVTPAVAVVRLPPPPAAVRIVRSHADPEPAARLRAPDARPVLRWMGSAAAAVGVGTGLAAATVILLGNYGWALQRNGNLPRGGRVGTWLGVAGPGFLALALGGLALACAVVAIGSWVALPALDRLVALDPSAWVSLREWPGVLMDSEDGR